MESSLILHTVLSVVSFLFIATFIAFLLRNSKIPYTVVLVLAGIGIGYAGEHLPFFDFVKDFSLSPELVFYLFLPTLIFESAFHMNFKYFTRTFHAISSLAVVGMLISMGLVATGMHYLIGMPWQFSLLFGSLISATDPISVLALFKKIGAPKRLATIVEGESLFNDGTALVLFGFFVEGQTGLIRSFASFFEVVLGGVLVGMVLGFIFSKALDYVKNSKEIEISITLILAHATFIISEYFFEVSGILATVAAGIVIGNYGAHKISYSVKEIMVHFWDYAGFLANSILFLMVGAIIFGVRDEILPLIGPLAIVIVLVLGARALMVYTILPIVNKLYPGERIPLRWMHIIQWSGLRGALSIALVLTLPANFPFYNEILIFTLGVIFVTIILNGFTIQPLLEWLGVHALTNTERFQCDEISVLVNQKVNKKLGMMRKKQFISEPIYTKVSNQYKDYCRDCNRQIKQMVMKEKGKLSRADLRSVLIKHLLGVEGHIYKKLYYYGEITQRLLVVLLHNIDSQINQADSGKVVRLGKLTLITPESRFCKFLSKIGFSDYCDRMARKNVMIRYEMYRARVISTSEALEVLKDLKKTNAYLDKDLLVEMSERYKKWAKNAKEKLMMIEKKYAGIAEQVQLYLAHQAALHVEDKVLNELYKSGAITQKIYHQLNTSFEDRQKNAETLLS